jgi:hypothetical protein
MSIDRRRGYPWRIKSLLLQSLQGDWPKPLLSRGTKATFDEYLIAAYEPAAAVLPDGLRCSDALIDWQEVTRAHESLGRLTQSGQVPGLYGQGRAMWIPVATETWLHVCGGIS